FNGAGGCAGCHSPTGDLAGIARKYKPVDLQSRFLMPRTRKPIIASVIPLNGEAVTGELQSRNTYEIVIRDTAGKSHSFDAGSVRIEVKDPLAAHRDLLPKYTDATMHDVFAYLWTLE